MPPSGNSNFDTQAVIAGLQHDESQAQKAVFDEYHSRLVNMIRSNVSGRLTRRLDPSDVALSAFRSFFLHARDGGFQIQNRRQLWGLLVTITLNKLRNQVRFHNADKRTPDREEPIGHQRERVASELPNPSDAAILNDELDFVLAKIKPFHKEIAERILAGQPSSEIATATNRSLRTVRRIEVILLGLIETQLKRDGSSERPGSVTDRPDDRESN